ncbi:MAG: hypothetical protein QOH41_705 [Blastocatellia bacterium]|nr:hypothetical protein [Blastocatellia bacterium]
MQFKHRVSSLCNLIPVTLIFQCGTGGFRQVDEAQSSVRNFRVVVLRDEGAARGFLTSSEQNVRRGYGVSHPGKLPLPLL